MRFSRITGLGLASMIILSGCVGAGSDQQSEEASSSTVNIFGSITVPPVEVVDSDGVRLYLDDPQTIPGGPSCTSSAGYDDIREGGQVTVTNATGEIIAVGSLGQGIQQAQDYDYGLWRRSEVLPDGRYAICEFSFSFEAPSGESFYTIALGNANRGDFTLSEGELSEGIALILGSP